MELWKPRAMRSLGGVAALALATAFAVQACTSDAIGIDACRAIESAKCTAAPVCEGSDTSFGIATEEQVRNCQIFYNDHCLVGLENTEQDPSVDVDVNPCVAAIEAASACQTAGFATMADCVDPETFEPTVVMVLGQEGLTPCAAIYAVENIEACAFVKTPPAE